MSHLSPESLAPRLQQAWLARWNQRVEHAMGELADIQTEAGWNELSPDALSPLKREDRAQYLEALLLKASLLRAQGQRRKASALLQKTLAKVDALQEPRGFRLLFELGLDHWIDHDVAPALEFFLLAERKARNPAERLFALSNVLWCLESLDLVREEIETRMRDLFAAMEDLSHVTHVSEQWQAYQLRKFFYTELKLPLASDFSGQAAFFHRWASALPYMGGNTAGLELSADYVWQGSYRVRTLAGIWIPSDREAVRVGDAIDRLYLWTWLWMAERPEITAEKLFYTLESVLQDLDLELQSKENLLLLRNALSWILLLEPAIGSRLQKTMAALRRVTSDRYPALEAEHFLTQLLSPQADAGDLALALRKFPVFEQILRETKSDAEGVLLPLLRTRLKPFLHVSASEHELIVDRLREEVRAPSGQVLRSPALVRLFSCLEKNHRVEFSSLGSADPRAVHNLVARARRLTSAKAIAVRGEEILRGPEWPEILFLHDVVCPDVHILPSKPGKKKFVDSEAHLQAARALLPAEFDRRALEKKLRVSKATACRMIEAWLTEEKISKSGNAKATVYSWKSKEMSL